MGEIVTICGVLDGGIPRFRANTGNGPKCGAILSTGPRKNSAFPAIFSVDGGKCPAYTPRPRRLRAYGLQAAFSLFDSGFRADEGALSLWVKEGERGRRLDRWLVTDLNLSRADKSSIRTLAFFSKTTHEMKFDASEPDGNRGV
jgi:hypothetical protein